MEATCQLIIPEPVRKQLNLQPGDELKQLLLGNSHYDIQYDIQGRWDLNFQDGLTGKTDINDIPASAVSGKISISQGYVQDILAAFRWYSFQDLA